MPKLNYIDTHAHLNFKEFEDDYPQVIKRAFSAGVKKIIIPSSDTKNAAKAVEIASNYENIYPTLGAHPLHIKGGFSLQTINGLPPTLLLESYNGAYGQSCSIDHFVKMASYREIVAIGEIGLDYKKSKQQPKVDRETQIYALKSIIKNTLDIDKPYILHCRPSTNSSNDALKDLYRLLKEHFSSYKKRLNGVIHCFAGDYRWAKRFNKLGFLVSYTGLITLTDRYDKDIKKIPLKNILIETDSPFLVPKGIDDDRCEPTYVIEVAKKIAKIKKIDLKKVAQTSTSRAEELFKI